MLALSYGTIKSANNFLSRKIDRKSIKEIRKVVEKKNNALSDETIVFLQQNNGKWYIN